MLQLGEIVVIQQLRNEGMTIGAIARRLGLDRKTVRKYLQRGLEPPVYGPRAPRPTRLDPYKDYLRQRLQAYPSLRAKRLLRELKELGYAGGYTAVKEFVRAVRPAPVVGYEHRFETPPGQQAQVDFARFVVRFQSEPTQLRVVWLFSLVLGHSRFLWGRYVLHQDLATLLRCHLDAFTALGGVPRQILYDRMKAVVIGEDEQQHVVYNRHLLDLARHCGFTPQACAAYRAKTKGKVERPFRYVREDFFLGRQFWDLADLNAQYTAWLRDVANVRCHGTTGRIVQEAFAQERPLLQPLPEHPYTAVLRVERRVSHEGVVSVDGNAYSVPDTTRARLVEVQVTCGQVQILEQGRLVAVHALQEGRGQRVVAPGHRRCPPPGPRGRRPTADALILRPGQHVPRRDLAVYDQIATSLAAGGAR